MDKLFSFLYHTCRILHLAIIHEEDSITQQLIQIFPKDVLDIQNNLYQVNATYLSLITRHAAEYAGISKSKSLWKQWYYLYLFHRTVVPLYLQSVLSGTSLWVVPVLAHKGLRMETPLLYLL